MLACPFLLKLSANLVKSEAQRIIAKTGPNCPIFSRYLSNKTTNEKIDVQDIPVKSLKNDILTSAETPISSEVNYTNLTLKQEDAKSSINLSSNKTISEITEQSSNLLFPKADDDVESTKYLPTLQSPARLKSPSSFDYNGFFQGELDKKKKDNTYRVFKKLLRRADNFPFAKEKSVKNKEVAVWCSNDYLGMSWHPLVMESALNAIRKHGTGSGGTRNISGNTILHETLEEDLARLHGKEAALVFTSCYVANEACLHTLGTRLPNVELFSDSGNHASMIHGIRTSKARKIIYRHNDSCHLDHLLSRTSSDAAKLVAFETVHSMSGNICPVEDLLDVCERHNALSFVDEVHAVGLYGYHGAGVAERDGVMDRIDIISGTLGKAYGNVGGYIAGDRPLVDMIRNYASGFIFTTSLPPHVLAAARKAIDILASDEGRQLRAQHQYVVCTVKSLLQQEGIPVINCPSHIIPIHVGHPGLCTHLSNELLRKYNIYVQAINHPTVAMGEERLRIAPSPHHTLPMIRDLVSAMVNLWKDNNLPLTIPSNERVAMAAHL